MTAKFIAFGGYDTRKPRVRLLIDALRRSGRLESEVLLPVWDDVAQTNVPSFLAVIGVLAKMIWRYPLALWQLFRSPKGAAILLPYPGIIEIFLIAPLAWIMRRKLVLDAFLPLYDTIVVDRGFAKEGGLRARFVHGFEKAGLKLADLILVDTDAHGDYFSREFGIDRAKFVTVLVGAEAGFAPDAGKRDDAADILGPVTDTPIVLFYGQLIPLHGVPTIIEAAAHFDGRRARWVMIGRGQLEPLLQEAVSCEKASALEWIEWVDYERLPAVIARADICLGVFGTSDKAGRVIPNKLFQQLAVGKRVITRSSEAVDALVERSPQAVITVPPGDPHALADAVARALSDGQASKTLPVDIMDGLTPDEGVAELIARLDNQAASATGKG